MGPDPRHQVRARQDLLDIWCYTSARWSVEQAELYLIEIDNRIQHLASGQARGTAHDSRYWRLRVGSHVVFYREDAREVTIVRVLHARMDAHRHLPRLA